MKMKKRHAASRIIALALAFALLFTSNAFALTQYSTLEYGSRGSDVLTLQKALLALGYDPNGLDGKFGRGTESAVVAYQKSAGLTADGKAGTQTLNALYSESDETDDSSDSSSSDSSSTRVSTNANTLEYGDSGDKVTDLQTALVALGYNTNGIDGRFGAGTRKAVIAFQKANNLTADGLAGTKTQTLLYSQASASESDSSDSSSDSSSSSSSSDSSSSDGSFTRTLRKGYTGSDVLSVQTQLKELGYYTSSLDGVYGAGTMAAVSSFQKNNNLSVDGLVGSKTYSKLFSSSAVASSSSSSSSSSGADSSSSSSSTTYVSLSYGDNNDDVLKLQKALSALGYSLVSDGDYGALTQKAVVAFQKLNGLTVDGVAGAKTQEVLYSGSAVEYDKSLDETTTIDDDTGKASGPSASSVKCLYWYTEVKPNISNGNYLTVFDPSTNLQWTLRVYSRGHHADCEPLTATDTAIMFKAFGYVNTWTPKAVYVKLPSGTWTLATMHNVPHLSGSIKDNDFDGHLCVHFLRTLEECEANDPNYGITHQKAIRAAWKALTGEDITD